MARATKRDSDHTLESQVDFIVDHLSKKDKDVFLREMLTTTLSGGKCNNIVASWHETAEINADPKRRRKLLLRKKMLFSLLQKDNG
jgi:hypothetical protein